MKSLREHVERGDRINPVTVINQRLRQLTGANGLPPYYQILLKAEVENNVATKLSLLAAHKIEVVQSQ